MPPLVKSRFSCMIFWRDDYFRFMMRFDTSGHAYQRREILGLRHLIYRAFGSSFSARKKSPISLLILFIGASVGITKLTRILILPRRRRFRLPKPGGL